MNGKRVNKDISLQFGAAFNHCITMGTSMVFSAALFCLFPTLVMSFFN